MWGLLRSELFRQRRRLLTKVLGGLLVVIIAGLYILLWIASGRVATGGFLTMRRALFLQETVPFGLQLVSFFWGLLSVVLAAGIFGSDYGWGTIRTLLLASRSRMALFSAKLFSILLLTVAGAVLGLVTALVTSTAITVRAGGADLSFVTPQYVGDATITFLRTVFTILPYISIALFFSTLGRSTLAGVAAALGWRFLEGLISSLLNLAGGYWAEIPDYLLRANVLSVQLAAPLSRNFTRSIGGNEDQIARLPSQEHAFAVLFLYIGLLILASAVIFQRRDVVT